MHKATVRIEECNGFWLIVVVGAADDAAEAMGSLGPFPTRESATRARQDLFALLAQLDGEPKERN